MLDNIGGDQVISSGVALWNGQGAARDEAPGLQTTFTFYDGSSGGTVRATSDAGTIEAELPASSKTPLAGTNNVRTAGKTYQVNWAVEHIGSHLKLTYTIIHTQ